MDWIHFSFENSTLLDGRVLIPEVQHPKSARKRLPQLDTFRNPIQLQSVALTHVRSSVGLIPHMKNEAHQKLLIKEVGISEGRFRSVSARLQFCISVNLNSLMLQLLHSLRGSSRH